MKIILPCVIMLIIASPAFSQQTSSAPALSKQDFLKKSKHERSTAWVLLGGGTIAWLAGASAYMNEKNDMGGTKGKPAMVMGGVAALASIPFFIAASKNKKKAATARLSMEKIPALLPQNMTYHPYPSLSLNIALQ